MATRKRFHQGKRRRVHRYLGIVLGLALGWMVAGAWQQNSFAAGGGGEGGEHANPAQHLAPGLHGHAQTPGWYRPVIAGVGGLFALAVVVGVVARGAGVKDPGVAASEYDHEHAEHH